MKIKNIFAVYFSPVGKTKLIASRLAGEIASRLGLSVKHIDYTLPSARLERRSFAEGDLVVWASPVYAGRLPNKLLPFVREYFDGNGAIAVPVVVFGNRSFDNALSELKKELKNNGFRIPAAAAFVAQHAFSQTLGVGRPDKDDFELLEEFAGKVVLKVLNGSEVTGDIDVPGEDNPQKYYTPLKINGEPAKFLKAKPVTDKAKCNKCLLCASRCPLGSISTESPDEVTGVCIKCQACVHCCPSGAKNFDDEEFISHRSMIEINYALRAQSEVFI